MTVFVRPGLPPVGFSLLSCCRQRIHPFPDPRKKSGAFLVRPPSGSGPCLPNPSPGRAETPTAQLPTSQTTTASAQHAINHHTQKEEKTPTHACLFRHSFVLVSVSFSRERCWLRHDTQRCSSGGREHAAPVSLPAFRATPLSDSPVICSVSPTPFPFVNQLNQTLLTEATASDYHTPINLNLGSFSGERAPLVELGVTSLAAAMCDDFCVLPSLHLSRDPFASRSQLLSQPL